MIPVCLDTKAHLTCLFTKHALALGLQGRVVFDPPTHDILQHCKRSLKKHKCTQWSPRKNPTTVSYRIMYYASPSGNRT